jgi:glycosidase
MQWDGSANAGFTSPHVTPWLPMAADYGRRNVVFQEDDPHAMLNLYRELTRLRRAERSLNAGAFRSIEVGSEGIFSYLRTAEDADRFLIVLNFEEQEVEINLSGIASEGAIEVSTLMERDGEVNLTTLGLRPNEGLVIRLG